LLRKPIKKDYEVRTLDMGGTAKIHEMRRRCSTSTVGREKILITLH
jgi:hypothetical protein